MKRTNKPSDFDEHNDDDVDVRPEVEDEAAAFSSVFVAHSKTCKCCCLG